MQKQSAEQEREALGQPSVTFQEEIQFIHEQCDYEMLLGHIRQALKHKEWLLFQAIYIDHVPPIQIATQWNITPAAGYLRKSRLDRKLRILLSKFKEF
jgi:hypothetical protein